MRVRIPIFKRGERATKQAVLAGRASAATTALEERAVICREGEGVVPGS